MQKKCFPTRYNAWIRFSADVGVGPSLSARPTGSVLLDGIFASHCWLVLLVESVWFALALGVSLA